MMDSVQLLESAGTALVTAAASYGAVHARLQMLMEQHRADVNRLEHDISGVRNLLMELMQERAR